MPPTPRALGRQDHTGKPIVATILRISISVVLAILVALAAYTKSPAAKRSRAVLLMLRTWALLLLFFLIAIPLLSFPLTRKERPHLAILIDASASMSLPDGRQTRHAALLGLLGREGPIHSLAQKGFALRFYRFGDDLKRIREDGWPDPGSLPFDAPLTNIGGSLERLAAEGTSDSVSAVVLVSDGANNAGPDPLRAARSLGVPVHTIGIGRRIPQHDVSILRVESEEIAYPQDRVPVEITLSAEGFQGEKTQLIIGEGGKVLASEPIALSSSGEQETKTLTLPFLSPGIHRFLASIPVQEGEVALNNQQEFAIRVLNDKIRVACLMPPSLELRFLPACLGAERDISGTFFIPRSGGLFAIRSASGERIAPLVQGIGGLRDFDVVILGGPPKELAPVLGLLTEFVQKRAGGLLLCAGKDLKEYARSPLGQILPVIPGRGTVSGPFHPVLTAQGKSSPLTSDLTGETPGSLAVEDLPPLLGCAQVNGVTAAASVLATHPESQNPQGKMPVITICRSGLGKVVLLTGYPWWRWDFLMEGVGKPGTSYRRLITNSIRWLSLREDARRLRVTTEQPLYQAGEEVSFQGRLYDEMLRGLDGSDVQVMVTRKRLSGERSAESGLDTIRLTLAGLGQGRYAGSRRILQPGDYAYRARATLQGQNLAEDLGRFGVTAWNQELDGTRTDPGLLQRIAAESGGRYWDAGDTGHLLSGIDPKPRITSTRVEFDLLRQPWLFALIVVILGLEWSLRKKWGVGE